MCLILILFDIGLTILFYYIREKYLNNIEKQIINFYEYTLIIISIGIIIIIFLFIKKIIFSNIASIIYIFVGSSHILYTIVIQLIELINKKKDIWKEIYFEQHINIYLFIYCIIIGIIRIYSFKKLKVYKIKIKNLEKFLKNEEKDFFFENLNEKLNFDENFNN